MARWMVDLPASLGPRMTVRPGREVDVELAVAAEVAAAGAGGSSQRDLVAGEQQAAEAERVAQLGGLGRSDPVASRARRCAPRGRG